MHKTSYIRTYPFSGNSSVAGFQYSIIPLASADITVSNIWLYLITFTGPKCIWTKVIIVTKTLKKDSLFEENGHLNTKVKLSRLLNIYTSLEMIGSFDPARAS